MGIINGFLKFINWSETMFVAMNLFIFTYLLILIINTTITFVHFNKKSIYFLHGEEKMTKNQLIMKQNMKRFIFAIIGISIAGILLVFGLFISESVKHKISENIELNENEYYLYINDSRFEEEPSNKQNPMF